MGISVQPKNGKVAYAGLGRFTGNKEKCVYRSELTPLRATLRLQRERVSVPPQRHTQGGGCDLHLHEPQY